MSQAVTNNDRKAVLATYHRLQDLARARCSTDLQRKMFSSKMATEEGMTVGAALSMLEEVLRKSKVRAAHRKQLEDDVQTLAKAARDDYLNTMPSSFVGALSVRVLSACESALADIDEALVATDAELQQHLEKVNISPEKLLQDELLTFKAGRGDRHALLVEGQPFSRQNRQMLLEGLEEQNALAFVSLTACSLRDADLDFLLPVLRGLQHLRVLQLKGNLLSVTAVKRIEDSLANTLHFPCLQVVDLSGNEAPAPDIAKLQRKIRERFQKGTSLKQDGWLRQLLEKEPTRRIKVLALDGGGAKCLAQLEVLVRLERELAKRKTCSGDSMCILNDEFDMVVGTGTGAIVAAAIRCGKPLSQIQKALTKVYQMVCTTNEWTILWAMESLYRGVRNMAVGDWYSGPAFQQLLDAELFGKDGITEDTKPFTIIMCTKSKAASASGVVSSNPKLGVIETCFRSYKSYVREPRGAVINSSLPLPRLCRACCATPNYFHPVTLDKLGSFFDGGVCFQNPAAVIFSELSQQVPINQITLVSVGSGSTSGPSMHSLLAEHLSRSTNTPAFPSFSDTLPPHHALAGLARVTEFNYVRLNPAPVRPLLLDYSALRFDESHPLALESIALAGANWAEKTSKVSKAVTALLVEGHVLDAEEAVIVDQQDVME
ncbi:putative inactive patatin-like protein 9 [Diplonema papillatum]|nr:putative inactive patatin-like protein 9 [Diplonema papillatum]|eukprot:gene20557-31663_t